jgi:fucose permease
MAFEPLSRAEPGSDPALDPRTENHEATARWKWSLFVLFALNGLGFASWVTRTPAIRDILGISTAWMGVVLLALALGAITGLIAASALIGRFGAKAVVLVAALAAAAGLAVAGAGSAWQTQGWVLAGLAILGCGNGIAEVGLNVEGSLLEHATGRTLLPALHASFSAGTLLGAGLGAGAIALGMSPTVHFLLVAAGCAAAAVVCVRFLPAGGGRSSHYGKDEDGQPRQGKPRWMQLRLIFIGLVVLGMAFAEGSANDWLPLAMVDGYSVSPAAAASTYAVFVTAMTIGRASGGIIVDRVGRVATLLATAVLGIIGLALVIAQINVAVAWVGVVMWAIGASLGFPVGLSAAGDEPQVAAARVSFVAAIGYFGFLAGPPLIGLLSHRFGLLAALTAVLIGLVVSAAFVPATRRSVGV